jgi:hypothetical protein
VLWTVEWVARVSGVAESYLEHKYGFSEESNSSLSSETILRDAFYQRRIPPHDELHFLLRKVDQPVCSRL